MQEQGQAAETSQTCWMYIRGSTLSWGTARLTLPRTPEPAVAVPNPHRTFPSAGSWVPITPQESSGWLTKLFGLQRGELSPELWNFIFAAFLVIWGPFMSFSRCFEKMPNRIILKEALQVSFWRGEKGR